MYIVCACVCLMKALHSLYIYTNTPKTFALTIEVLTAHIKTKNLLLLSGVGTDLAGVPV